MLESGDERRMSTGYKAKSDSYLMRMTKAEIIEDLREAECELSSLEEEFKKAVEYARKSCDRLEEENAELKRMLKIAVEDIHNRSYCGMCENGIPIDNDVCDRCKAMTLDMFEWRHKAEAMKLIGEEK